MSIRCPWMKLFPRFKPNNSFPKVVSSQAEHVSRVPRGGFKWGVKWRSVTWYIMERWRNYVVVSCVYIYMYIFTCTYVHIFRSIYIYIYLYDISFVFVVFTGHAWVFMIWSHLQLLLNSWWTKCFNSWCRWLISGFLSGSVSLLNDVACSSWVQVGSIHILLIHLLFCIFSL